MSTDYKGKIMYSMTQAKFNELREANGGKLPAQYANSYVYTDAEDVNLSCLRPVLLWENDSPTLSFPQRTIEDIIPNNCDYFEIGYRYDTTNNFQKSDLIKADAGVRGLLSFVNTPNIMLARALTINSKTSISFSASYRGTGSSESVDNTTIIPLYVIGYTKEPAMIYTGAELHDGNGISIKDGVISSSPSIITIHLPVERTIDAKTQISPTMTEVVKVGDKLNFVNNEIVIGDGVSVIKASSKAFYIPYSASSVYCYIIKNGNNLTVDTNYTASSSSINIGTSNILIPVTAGDRIGIGFYSSSAGTLMGDKYRTYLTVEVVK